MNNIEKRFILNEMSRCSLEKGRVLVWHRLAQMLRGDKFRDLGLADYSGRYFINEFGRHQVIKMR